MNSSRAAALGVDAPSSSSPAAPAPPASPRRRDASPSAVPVAADAADAAAAVVAAAAAARPFPSCSAVGSTAALPPRAPPLLPPPRHWAPGRGSAGLRRGRCLHEARGRMSRDRSGATAASFASTMRHRKLAAPARPRGPPWTPPPSQRERREGAARLRHGRRGGGRGGERGGGGGRGGGAAVRLRGDDEEGEVAHALRPPVRLRPRPRPTPRASAPAGPCPTASASIARPALVHHHRLGRLRGRRLARLGGRHRGHEASTRRLALSLAALRRTSSTPRPRRDGPARAGAEKTRARRGAPCARRRASCPQPSRLRSPA